MKQVLQSIKKFINCASIAISASTAPSLFNCCVEAAPMKEVPLEHANNLDLYRSILTGIGNNNPFRALILYYFEKHADLLDILDINSKSDFAKILENSTLPNHYYISGLITTFPESLFDVHYLHSNNIIDEESLALFINVTIYVFNYDAKNKKSPKLFRLLANSTHYKTSYEFLSLFLCGTEAFEKLGITNNDNHNDSLFKLSLFCNKTTAESQKIKDTFLKNVKISGDTTDLASAAKEAFNSSIYSHIIYNDIEKLEQFTSNNELTTYSNKKIGPKKLILNPIDFAALFGAEQAFNLILAKALLFKLEKPTDTALFACTGGNIDIISTLFRNYQKILIGEQDAISQTTDKDIVSYLYNNNSIIHYDIKLINNFEMVTTSDLDNLIALNKLVKTLHEDDIYLLQDLGYFFWATFRWYDIYEHIVFRFAHLNNKKFAKWPSYEQRIYVLASNGIAKNFIDGFGNTANGILLALTKELDLLIAEADFNNALVDYSGSTLLHKLEQNTNSNFTLDAIRSLFKKLPELFKVIMKRDDRHLTLLERKLLKNEKKFVDSLLEEILKNEDGVSALASESLRFYMLKIIPKLNSNSDRDSFFKKLSIIINNGCSLTKTDEHGNTFMHDMAIEYCTPFLSVVENYIDLLDNTIPTQVLQAALLAKNDAEKTPLDIIEKRLSSSNPSNNDGVVRLHKYIKDATMNAKSASQIQSPSIFTKPTQQEIDDF